MKIPAGIRYSQLSTLIATIIDHGGRARREGFLSLQNVANETDDPFSVKGVNPVADGVEGYKDDREHQSPAHPSGWELSLARTHSVLEVLRRQRIREGRLSLGGYGPSHPRYDSLSRLGRARNRRVEIVITGR